jgi:hypothetical protein
MESGSVQYILLNVVTGGKNSTESVAIEVQPFASITKSVITCHP